VQDVEDGLSEFPHVILNQARVHDFFLDVMRSAPTRLEPDYSRRLLDLTIAPEGERNESAATSHPAGVDGLCSLTVQGRKPLPDVAAFGCRLGRSANS
jgi:phenol 2-monooxygenase (NADPH)